MAPRSRCFARGRRRSPIHACAASSPSVSPASRQQSRPPGPPQRPGRPPSGRLDCACCWSSSASSRCWAWRSCPSSCSGVAIAQRPCPRLRRVDASKWPVRPCTQVSEVVSYGRYQLIKRLASGGMAQVWLARQSGMEGFEKLLVIKQVLPHLAGTEEFITMFFDEARLAARLNHPNVVQVFDLGRVEEDDTLYIAMEYIHGEDLRRIDRESRRLKRPIPIPLVCKIISEAAAGLHYAHTMTAPDGTPLGIVHRDVSPQNILVTFEGGVKVVDFGIAKAADKATKTRSGVLKGKYAYMSPEQAAGKEVDHRTDIFALGIMLHELLTGQRLFKRKSEIMTLHAVVRAEVVPPSQLNPVVPPELDPIVLRALAKRKEDRWPTAEAFQLALENYLTERRESVSSAHLRQYMREIFAERLEIEAREGGPAAYLAQRGTGSRSVGLGGATPSRLESRPSELKTRADRTPARPRADGADTDDTGPQARTTDGAGPGGTRGRD
ncbi:MAG: serine/threonine protein kinase, partial [Deltaproteobacteria bacterium]